MTPQQEALAIDVQKTEEKIRALLPTISGYEGYPVVAVQWDYLEESVRELHYLMRLRRRQIVMMQNPPSG